MKSFAFEKSFLKLPSFFIGTLILLAGVLVSQPAQAFFVPPIIIPTFYTVSYNGNGNDGGTVPSTQFIFGPSVTVLGNSGGLVKSGYAFSGWNTAADGSGTAYSADQTFSIISNVTLYAAWVSPSPTLTLVKNVVNTVGGVANVGSSTSTQWTLSATSTVGSISGRSGSASVTGATVSAGTYSLSESDGPPDYAASPYSCIKNSGEAVVGNSITLSNGDSATCSITNTAIPATLTIVKTLVGTTGGGNFYFHIASSTNSDVQAQSTNGTVLEGRTTATSTVVTLAPGTYDVTEDTSSNWTFVGVSCIYNNESVGNETAGGERITVDAGDAVTCTFTNHKGIGILGTKWNDVNGNGVRDRGEGGIPAWTIVATPVANADGGSITDTESDSRTATSTVTDGNGNYSFFIASPREAGEYWKITETPKDGWTQTYPRSGSYVVRLNYYLPATNIDFGNHENPAPTPPTLGAGGGGDNGAPIGTFGGGGGGANGQPNGGNNGGSGGANNGQQGGEGQVLGASTFKFLINLQLGMKNNDVGELQKVLIAEGFLKIDAPTGYFGQLTLAAVKAYQKAHGIKPVSGFVGPLTRAELNK